MELTNIQKEIKESVKILQNGGVILYPSDAIWGIGCDATNADAIEKIYKLKRRAENKALISLVYNKITAKIILWLIE